MPLSELLEDHGVFVQEHRKWLGTHALSFSWKPGTAVFHRRDGRIGVIDSKRSQMRLNVTWYGFWQSDGTIFYYERPSLVSAAPQSLVRELGGLTAVAVLKQVEVRDARS